MDKLAGLNPGMAIIEVKFASKLAILNQGKAKKIMKDFLQIDHWTVGGHSLGGVVSALSIKENPDAIDGLILLASRTTNIADISGWAGKVLSIYGTNDGVADITEQS